MMGIVILAFGTALMEKADFGMSMIVAPAYILHLKISEVWSHFTFGMAEYCLQLVLILILMTVLRKVRICYLFSFITAVIYGQMLDLFMLLLEFVSGDGMSVRIAYFVAGLLACQLGVVFFFHTYLAPEAYELLVKEIAREHKWKISIVKTVYDMASLLISVILSFAFFGLWNFVGVNVGTVISAVVNGVMIGLFSRMLERWFAFKDAFRIRKWFE